MVDFLLTTNGTPNWPVFFQTKTHCAARLSKNISASDNLGIYFDCGLNDELGMLACNAAFKDTLSVRNIPYNYKYFAGANHWGLLFTDRIPAAIHFLDSVMNYPEDALNSLINTIDGFNLEFGISTALKAKLYTALDYWSIDDYDGVCSSAQDFINFVNAQTGKKVSEAQALILLNEANSIRSALDCGPGGDMTPNNNTEPYKFGLYQNYPNPFNPVTTIQFAVPEQALVELKVYDMLGREIATLINEVLTEGVHQVKFDGAGLSSGIYFYVLKSGDLAQTRKMLLIK
jgi:hypothetical protein